MKNLQAPNSANRFRRHSVNLFFIKFFSTVASFLVIYYYSHHLSEADYGAYQTIWTRSLFLSAFAGLGIASLVFTYTPAALKKLLTSLPNRKKALLSMIPLACSLLLAGLQAESINGFLVYFTFFSLYIACNTLEITLGALQLFRWLPVVSFLYGVGFFAIHYYVFSAGYEVLFLFTLLLPLLFFRCAVYIAIIVNGLKRITTANDTDEWNSTKIKSLWQHLYFFEASQIVILYADKFFLSHFLPASQFAVYFNATISIPFIGLVFSAINNAAFMEYAHQESQEKKITVLLDTGKVMASVAFPFFFFLWFFSEELFSILFSDKYLASIPIFLTTLLALPIRSIYPNILVLQSNHRGDIINKGVLVDVAVSLLLLVPLYLAFGLIGVALSFVIGTLFQAAYYLIVSGKIMGVPVFTLIPFKNWLIKLALFGAGIFVVHEVLKTYLNPLQLLVSGGIGIGGLSFIFFWKEFSQSHKPDNSISRL